MKLPENLFEDEGAFDDRRVEAEIGSEELDRLLEENPFGEYFITDHDFIDETDDEYC